MERIARRALGALLCALLLLPGCRSLFPGGSPSEPSSVQMIDFNRDLEPVKRDDDYRTTYEIFVYSFCDSDATASGI